MNTFNKDVAVMLSLKGETLQVYVESGTPTVWHWVDIYDTVWDITDMSYTEMEGLDDELLFRVKPETIRIGSVDVPKPLSYQPVRGTEVFSPDILLTGYDGKGDYIVRKFDSDKQLHLYLLSRGMLHLTADAATLHTAALVEISLQS